MKSESINFVHVAMSCVDAAISVSRIFQCFSFVFSFRAKMNLLLNKLKLVFALINYFSDLHEGIDRPEKYVGSNIFDWRMKLSHNALLDVTHVVFVLSVMLLICNRVWFGLYIVPSPTHKHRYTCCCARQHRYTCCCAQVHFISPPKSLSFFLLFVPREF